MNNKYFFIIVPLLVLLLGVVVHDSYALITQQCAGTCLIGKILLQDKPLIQPPAPGYIEFNNHTFYATTYLVRRSVQLMQDPLIDDLNINSTTATTRFYENTYAATYFTRGKIFKTHIMAEYSTQNPASSFTIRVYHNSTNATIITFTNVAGLVTNVPLYMTITFNINSINNATGLTTIDAFSTVQADNANDNTYSTTTFNSSQPNTIAFDVTWNNANAANRIIFHTGYTEAFN